MKRTSKLSTKKGLKSKTGLNKGKGLVSKKSMNRGSGLKAKKKISGKSVKQQQTNDKYYETCQKMFRENEKICTGCRNVYGVENLTHSHLVPRSRRPDLIAEYKNLTYHCIDCHVKWESVDRVELLDYEENMQIVYELDIEYHELLLMKQSMYNKKH